MNPIWWNWAYEATRFSQRSHRRRMRSPASWSTSRSLAQCAQWSKGGRSTPCGSQENNRCVNQEGSGNLDFDGDLFGFNFCWAKFLHVLCNELIGVPDIIFQLREGFTLDDDPRNLFQSPDVPAVVHPKLEGEVPQHASSLVRSRRVKPPPQAASTPPDVRGRLEPALKQDAARAKPAFDLSDISPELA